MNQRPALSIAKLLSLLLGLFFSYIYTEQKIVTIWLHGTMPPVPKAIRESHFHLNFGITHIKDYIEKNNFFTKRALSLANIAKTLHQTMPAAFDLEHYYIFGWSGKLSFTEREEYAQKLYLDILQLKEKYLSTYGDLPYIRLIGHSHGGNVILNLAQTINNDTDFYVDEIILLACPVQEKTECYIQAACFKKVYAFYSSTDLIQIIDPQGFYEKHSTKKTLSDRSFKHHKTLRQACVKINGRSIMHIDFISAHFLEQLPELCKEIDHFYTTIMPSQIAYEKIINIHKNKDGSVVFYKRLNQI